MPDQREASQAPAFFPTPADLQIWFTAHHDATSAVWVGFYKKSSGKPSVTWPEAVDEALCFGWIDGVRKSIDATSYMIRFTPRKPRSIWSAVNCKRVEELRALGRMHSNGLAAFAARVEAKSGIYSHEQECAALDHASEEQFRANATAWNFFQAQPAGYRKAAIWRIISAKRAETKQKRLLALITASEHGRTIQELTRLPR